MKKFTQNIASQIMGDSHVRVTKGDNWTRVQWGKSMSQIGSGYVYCLSWKVQDGQVVWVERDQDYNIVENTGMTCICDDINLDGDGLFVRLEVLDKEKDEILAAAAEFDAEQSVGN